MKNKSILFAFLGHISFLITACDPGLTNIFMLENESDYTCEATYRFKEGYRNINESDTFHKISIDAKLSSIIAEYGEIGAAHDKEQMFLEAFDTIYINVAGVSINKKIGDRKIWKYKVVKNRLFSDEVEYKLTITNDDVDKNK